MWPREYLVDDSFLDHRTVLMSEAKEIVSECERLRSSTQLTSDSFTQLVTHHRRFLTTCVIACPSNQLQPPTPPAEITDEMESFVHLGDETVGEEQSRLSKAQSRLGNAQSRLSDSQSRHGDTESRHGDGQSRHGDGQPRYGDGQSRLSNSDGGSGFRITRIENDSKATVTGLRDALEDLVNNLVEEDKKVLHGSHVTDIPVLFMFILSSPQH
jgi:hypothetical protein